MTPVHVVLPAAILACSPSAEDGVDATVERAHRFFGCELIQEAGVLLRLPQVVLATAQTLLQRFYYRKSLLDFDAFRVAMACLFLAAKVEERPKRIKDLLGVFYAMYRRRKWRRTRVSQQLLDLEGATYCQWREWLIKVERQVLIDMGFSIYNVTKHPHKYVLYYVKVLDGSPKLAQQAWGYINDSLRSDLCVRYKAEAIACAAIFLASRFQGVSLPNNPPWYTLFDVAKPQLYAVSVALMELYKHEKLEWLEPLTKVNPFAKDDSPLEQEESEPEVVAGTTAKTASMAKVSLQEPSSFTTTAKTPSSAIVNAKPEAGTIEEVKETKVPSTPVKPPTKRRSRWDDGSAGGSEATQRPDRSRSPRCSRSRSPRRSRSMSETRGRSRERARRGRRERSPERRKHRRERARRSRSRSRSRNWSPERLGRSRRRRSSSRSRSNGRSRRRR